MPTAKDTILATVAAAGLAMGAAALVRSGPTAPPELRHVAGQPTPPDKCLTFCRSLPEWCTIGGSANCADIMRRTERESADGGPHFSCSEPVAQSWLDVWCPNHGEAHPLSQGTP